jgi:hypothetical protein
MLAHIVGLPIEEVTLTFAPVLVTVGSIVVLALRRLLPRFGHGSAVGHSSRAPGGIQ